MRIHLPSVGVPAGISAINDFRHLAEVSATARHDLVEDADSADVLLFTECHQLNDPIFLGRVRSSEAYRAHREKSFVFDQRPRSYCSLPGLYTSVPWHALRRAYQVPWSYHTVEDTPYDPDRETDLLFSFVGTGRSHRCREQLFGLKHPRALIERVDGHVNWHPDSPGYTERRDFFADSLRRSAFVLCPRGRATSSFRFYEVMAAGRVPVVLADAWIPPVGIDVTEFAIIWPEADVEGLPRYLESQEHRAAEMGRRAREVFETRFAPEVMWDRIGDALEQLAATLPWRTFPAHGFPPDRRVVRHIAGRARKQLQRLRS